MEANELRVGNYVQNSEGKLIEVSMIGYSGVNYSGNGIIEMAMIEHSNKFCNLQPLPITEQWFLDFGFEKKSRIDYGELKPCFAKFSFAVMIRHNSYFIDWFGGNTEIKHVHSLQNLYFSLTGQELTLKEK